MSVALSHHDGVLAAHMAATMGRLGGPTAHLALLALGRCPAAQALADLRQADPGLGGQRATNACATLVALGLAIRFGPDGEDAVFALSVAGIAEVEVYWKALRESAERQRALRGGSS